MSPEDTREQTEYGVEQLAVEDGDAVDEAPDHEDLVAEDGGDDPYASSHVDATSHMGDEGDTHSRIEVEDSSSSDEEDERRTGEVDDNRPRFGFARQGPGARPVTDVARAFKKGRRARLPEPPAHPIPVWDEECAKVLQADWSKDYESCPEFARPWTQIKNQERWPEGYSLHEGKLMHFGHLCVPWKRAMAVMNAHHVWNAHQGVDRLVVDLQLHYNFPSEIDIRASVIWIKKHCMVCQACIHANWPT